MSRVVTCEDNTRNPNFLTIYFIFISSQNSSIIAIKLYDFELSIFINDVKWPLIKNNQGFPSAKRMSKSLGDPSETPRDDILTTPRYTIIFHPGKVGNKNIEILWCPDSSPTDISPTRHFPNGHFHDGHFLHGHFPNGHFPDQTHPWQTLIVSLLIMPYISLVRRRIKKFLNQILQKLFGDVSLELRKNAHQI